MENIIYEYNYIEDKYKNLLNHIIDNKPLHKYFSQDWSRVKAKQYCGILNYDRKDYYILPKISKDDSKSRNLDIFIYMLKFVYNIKIENEEIASSKNIESNNLLEIFIQVFAKNLFKELQKGIYKEYITEQENLTTLKGKYLINENLKYNFTNSKIYCEYDEFSANNKLNQFFLYAIKTLMSFTKNKKLLKMCELVLDDVEYRHIDIDMLKIHFHRLNQRFKNSFEFAILLLKKSIPLFEKDKKSFAFLFNMNELFERFVGKLYKELYSDTKTPKSSRKFGDLYLKPDIIINSKNLIIDCKYKIIEDDKIASRADRYQMYVYGNNYENINTTMLLYPQHLDNIDKKIVLGDNNRKVELLMKSINLDFCGNYEEYIDVMKSRVREII